MEKDVAVLTQQVENLAKSFEKFEEKIDTYISQTEARLRSLEDFKLTFVVKFSVYSSIALFSGSVVSTIAIHLVTNYLSK